ncbi:MAG: universal stress protein UspA [Bacteroidetes bacterium QS_9_68_14]|nr:MAG: universal stress protein UspA [Bacteroidetes bacterium QS_9_68_14]
MDVETVLVPVDGSDESMAAAEYAVAVADAYDAAVHALYVFGEGVVRGLEVGDLEAQQVAAESESFMTEMRELTGDVALTHATAPGFSLSRLSQHPGSVVLDAAADVDADFLVVPREQMTDETDAVLERAAEYVIAHASQPVLSV